MKHTLDLPVQFRDFDVFGHVNSTTYLRYMETARVELVRSLVRPDPWHRPPLIVVAQRIEYKRAITESRAIRVSVWTSRIGSRSWDFDYEIQAAAGETSAFGRTTQVAYDHERSATAPIPPELRTGLERFTATPLEFHETTP